MSGLTPRAADQRKQTSNEEEASGEQTTNVAEVGSGPTNTSSVTTTTAASFIPGRSSFTLLRAPWSSDWSGRPESPIGEPLAAPSNISRSTSRNNNNNDPSLENPVDLIRSTSRQAPQVPAWMENEMTALSTLTRAASAPKPVTPRPPPDTDADDEDDLEDDEQQAGQVDEVEDSRMLRHLEQHTHLQEEMQAEDVVNPQRMEQIQRENNRLMHIAMRRERAARSMRKNSGQESFSPPSPLMSPLRTGERSDEDESTSFWGKKPAQEDEPQTAYKRAGFFKRQSAAEPEFGVNGVPRADEMGTEMDRLEAWQNGGESMEEGGAMKQAPASASTTMRKTFEFSPRASSKSPRPQSKSPRDAASDASQTRLQSEGTATGGAASSSAEKSKMTGFGFARLGSNGGLLNLSSRRRGGATTPKRHNHLPPSFTGARQRSRLVELLKNIDLEDATLWDAVRKVKPLHPQGFFRRNWDRLLAIGVIWTLISVPVEVAWDTYDAPFRGVGVFLDIIFILDVALAFRTSYREVNDEYVRDFDQIAHHYLRTWFAVDLIAAIPVNIIFIIVASSVSADIQNYLSLIKLLKVFRVVRLRHLFYSLAGLRFSAALYTFAFVGGFVLFAHWLACILWKIADLENSEGSISWASFQQSIPDPFSKPETMQYSTSMYFAMMTLCTLGYGDIHAVTYTEQIVISIVIICGATLYATVIGLISFIVRTHFDSELRRETYIGSVRTFGRNYNLPLDLQKRIQQYYDFLWERKKRLNSKSLVDDLPLELRADVADAVYKKLIESNPVLRACTSFGFKKLFAARLSSSTIRIPDDVLYFEGDPVTEIFFVKKGMVEIVFGLDRGAESEFVVSRRGDGQHLGDLGLFVKTKRQRAGSIAKPNVDDTDDDDDTAGYDEDDLFFSRDEQEADSEEETEFSGADHFTGDGVGRTTGNKPRKPTSQRLNHISAVVTDFSEISSILVSDFLQLLEQFPREKRLFRAVAIARFKRIRHLVSTRLALLSNDSPSMMALYQSLDIESPKPSGPLGIIKDAVAQTKTALKGMANPSASPSHAGEPPLPQAVPSDFRPGASGLDGDPTASNSSIRGKISSSLGGLFSSSRNVISRSSSGNLGKDQRASQWRRMWQKNVAPEADNELVSRTVDKFLKEEKERSPSTQHMAFMAAAKRKSKNPLRATEFLMSPALRPLRKPQVPSPADGESAAPQTQPQPQPQLLPRPILKASSTFKGATTTSVTSNDEAAVSPSAIESRRHRSRSENNLTGVARESPTKRAHPLSPRTTPTTTPTMPTMMGFTAPPLSANVSTSRRRRFSMGLPGEQSNLEQASSSRSLGREPSSSVIGTGPAPHQHQLEDRLRALLDKVRRLDDEVDSFRTTTLQTPKLEPVDGGGEARKKRSPTLPTAESQQTGEEGGSFSRKKRTLGEVRGLL